MTVGGSGLYRHVGKSAKQGTHNMQPYRTHTGVVAPLDRVNVDIFYNNCLKNGMLPITLPEETVNEIMSRAQERPGYTLTVDLEKETIEDEEGVVAHFEVDEFRRHCLLEGLDDIGLTLQHADAIADYEHRRSELLPVAAS